MRLLTKYMSVKIYYEVFLKKTVWSYIQHNVMSEKTTSCFIHMQMCVILHWHLKPTAVVD